MKKTITEMFYDLPGSREYIRRLAEGESPENLSENPDDNKSGEKNSDVKNRDETGISDDKEESGESPENRETSESPENTETSDTSNKSDTSDTSPQKADSPDKTDIFLVNIADSLQLLRGFAAGRGLSTENLDSVLLSLFRLTRDTARGIVTIENIEKLLKALTYDSDMANARYEGEIAGRNARIEIEMRKTFDSDGVPRMSGKSTSGASALPGSIFDLVRSARD